MTLKLSYFKIHIAVIVIYYRISHLTLNNVPHPNLVCVVYNKLVHAHVAVFEFCFFAHGYLDIFFNYFGTSWVWPNPSQSFSTLCTWRHIFIMGWRLHFIELSQCHLAHDENTNTIGKVWTAVSSGLASLIGKIDTFTKVVTTTWCFWWSNSHAV